MSALRPAICISGVAGFIGFHAARRFLGEGYRVIGIDNLNNYYDPQLKAARLALLSSSSQFHFHKMDICEGEQLLSLIKGTNQLQTFLHLAAQAGVRYSISSPFSYAKSNLTGFLHILETCAKAKVPHLMYASSSSVYGANKEQPFCETQPVEQPVSLYAATKKSNELMAHAYASLYGLPCTGLRFFTVYGPYGRPDMALFKFTKAILEDKPIDLYNRGQMSRDFTYIDDAVEAIYRLQCSGPPQLDRGPAASHVAPYCVYNIGSQRSVALGEFVEILEDILGRRAKKRLLGMQKGEVTSTYASTSALHTSTGCSASTSLRKGVESFVNWYLSHYQPQASAAL